MNFATDDKPSVLLFSNLQTMARLVDGQARWGKRADVNVPIGLVHVVV